MVMGQIYKLIETVILENWFLKKGYGIKLLLN
jgi:hypothetical protein